MTEKDADASRVGRVSGTRELERLLVRYRAELYECVRSARRGSAKTAGRDVKPSDSVLQAIRERMRRDDRLTDELWERLRGRLEAEKRGRAGPAGPGLLAAGEGPPVDDPEEGDPRKIADQPKKPGP